MPCYEFCCEECTHLEVSIRSIEDRNDARSCSRCGGMSRRLFSTFAHKEFPAYTRPTVRGARGAEITSAKKEREYMRRNKKVLVAETPWYNDFKSQRRLARRKPIYSTLAGITTVKRG